MDPVQTESLIGIIFWLKILGSCFNWEFSKDSDPRPGSSTREWQARRHRVGPRVSVRGRGLFFFNEILPRLGYLIKVR